METIFYCFKDLIEVKNFRASELAETFSNYYVSPEDFKKFIEKHGNNNKLFFDLLVRLWDDFPCSDFGGMFWKKCEQSDLCGLDILYGLVNEWTSIIIDTSLVRFFRLAAKLCEKYKNLEIDGKLIDTKKYFIGLFSMLPKECVRSKKEITFDIEKATGNKLFYLCLVIEDINLDNKSLGSYLDQFLSLISIKSLESEDKYLYEFIASVLGQYFFSSDEKLGFHLNPFFNLPMVVLCKIAKRKITKNQYCLKDKEFIDLVDSLRKIYGDKDWIRFLCKAHDGNFLRFISKVLNNFKETKEPEEKTDEANKIKIKIFFKLLSLDISEAFHNGYKINIFNLVFDYKPEKEYIFEDSSSFDFLSLYEFFLSAFNGILYAALENTGLNIKKYSKLDSDWMCENFNILTSLCLLNYVGNKNAKESLCKLKPEFAFLLGLILAKTWNCDDFIYDEKEYTLEKLFSYNCNFLFAFLANEVIFDSNNATLEKYVGSMKPDSEQKDKLIEMILRISEDIVNNEPGNHYYAKTSFLKELNLFQSEGKKLDEEEIKKEEFHKLAKDKLINFLVDNNKECFGDLANEKDSILNEIKGDQKPVPKMQNNKNKDQYKCMII